jgi:hypothetical protein
MFETQRMLGQEREKELLREADRLHAGATTRRRRVWPRPRFALLFSRRKRRTTEQAQGVPAKDAV